MLTNATRFKDEAAYAAWQQGYQDRLTALENGTIVAPTQKNRRLETQTGWLTRFSAGLSFLSPGNRCDPFDALPRRWAHRHGSPPLGA
jgi:hypothetical protein